MVKYLKTITIFLISIFIVYQFGYIIRNKLNVNNTEGISLVSKTQGKHFEVFKNGKWEKTFLKGVSMGAAKPGYYPGEFGITKEEYLRWFKQIKEMNAEVIRVYTLHMPDFYEALYEFNRHRKDPLYLIQGVWVDEETMLEKMDAFNYDVIENFREETKTIIDVIHGNGDVEKKIARGYGKYDKDVSPYVVGYVLGVEWDPNFVYETNSKNKGMEQFNGDWLYTEDAEPIEIFFADIGNTVIDYETKKYKSQKPIAFTNWLTTDVISHENEPEIENKLVDIDTQRVKSKENFKGGLFASYHIYPYYPDFLNFEPKYAEFIDKDGEKNSYRAYLRDLISRYEIPVIVGEFGVPTSRGITHEDLIRGFNQGLINEKSQGEMNVKMIEEIYEEGYAGTLLFTWQDEWFKRAWNTMEYDYKDNRAYWSDKMTNEKYFGLLAFDPGENKSKVYNDGNIKDWRGKNLISENDNIKIYGNYDESYVYLRVSKDNFDINKDKLLITLDTTKNSGSNTMEGYNGTFDNGVDYVIKIDGEDNTEVLVQEYYDIYKYLFEENITENKNTTKFNSIRQCVLGNIELPLTGQKIDMKGVEVGKLIYGNGNPKSSDYNSLSDFYINGDDIEIRIPWLMLNIADPSTKKIIGDFNKENKITYQEIEGIKIGVSLLENNNIINAIELKEFSWKPWEMPTYHERLKESYYKVKDIYNNLE